MIIKFSDYQNGNATADEEGWKRRAFAAKWLANFRCQACGRKTKKLECHHNNYEMNGNERPEDLTPLCTVCHPYFEWLKKGGADDIRKFVRDVLARSEETHLRLEEIGRWFDEYRKAPLLRKLSEIEEDIRLLDAMSCVDPELVYKDEFGDEWAA